MRYRYELSKDERRVVDLFDDLEQYPRDATEMEIQFARPIINKWLQVSDELREIDYAKLPQFAAGAQHLHELCARFFKLEPLFKQNATESLSTARLRWAVKCERRRAMRELERRNVSRKVDDVLSELEPEYIEA